MGPKPKKPSLKITSTNSNNMNNAISSAVSSSTTTTTSASASTGSPCFKCGIIFAKKEDFQQHMASHQSSSVTSSSESIAGAAAAVGNDQQESSAQHRRCHECDQLFEARMEDEFNEHLLIHDLEKIIGALRRYEMIRRRVQPLYVHPPPTDWNSDDKTVEKNDKSTNDTIAAVVASTVAASSKTSSSGGGGGGHEERSRKASGEMATPKGKAGRPKAQRANAGTSSSTPTANGKSIADPSLSPTKILLAKILGTPEQPPPRKRKRISKGKQGSLPKLAATSSNTAASTTTASTPSQSSSSIPPPPPDQFLQSVASALQLPTPMSAVMPAGPPLPPPAVASTPNVQGGGPKYMPALNSACPNCGQNLGKPWHLVDHMIQMHDAQLLRLHRALKKPDGIGGLVQGSQLFADRQCPFCQLTYADMQTSLLHVVRTHRSRLFECPDNGECVLTCELMCAIGPDQAPKKFTISVKVKRKTNE